MTTQEATAVQAPDPPPEGLSRPAGVPVSGYIPELESLRGWAIFLVYWFHVDGFVLMPGGRTRTTVSPLLAFVGAGHSGVDLFFVLSGFLLSLPFVAEAYGGRRVSRSRYYSRRVLRIVPLFWASVIVGTLLSATRRADLLRAVPYLFFLHPYLTTPIPPYSNVWWSLTTEAQFYLVLPVVALATRSRPGRILAAIALAAYVPLYVAYNTGKFHLQPMTHNIALGLSLFGRAPVFLAGAAAAWMYFRHGASLRARLATSPWLRNGGADALLLIVLATLGYLLRWVIASDFMWVESHDHWWHAAGGVLWSVVLLAVLIAPLRSKPLLSNRLLATLGVLSYSIYILHIPIILPGLAYYRVHWPHTATPTGWTPPTTVVVGILTLLTIVAANLTYRWIERPFLAQKARLAR